MSGKELFPHPNYPIRLEVKNTDNSTVCYFSCVDHLQAYLERNKPKKSDLQIDYNPDVFSKEEIDSMSGNEKPKKRTTRTKKTVTND